MRGILCGGAAREVIQRNDKARDSQSTLQIAFKNDTMVFAAVNSSGEPGMERSMAEWRTTLPPGELRCALPHALWVQTHLSKFTVGRKLNCNPPMEPINPLFSSFRTSFFARFSAAAVPHSAPGGMDDRSCRPNSLQGPLPHVSRSRILGFSASSAPFAEPLPRPPPAAGFTSTSPKHASGTLAS